MFGCFLATVSTKLKLVQATGTGLCQECSWVYQGTECSQRDIYEQDTLKSTARGSHNKQSRIACGTPNLSKKKVLTWFQPGEINVSDLDWLRTWPVHHNVLQNHSNQIF
jgi:hypothetical protein